MDASRLSERHRWILDFLTEHEWATPALLRHVYNDEHDDVELSRHQINRPIRDLRSGEHIEHVHPDASEYQLVDDPRE